MSHIALNISLARDVLRQAAIPFLACVQDSHLFLNIPRGQ